MGILFSRLNNLNCMFYQLLRVYYPSLLHQDAVGDPLIE